MRDHEILSVTRLDEMGSGPLYVKLQRLLRQAISNGWRNDGDAIPTEREIAEHTKLSRVTVRKAVDDLVRQGRLIRRQGSGTFVATTTSRVEQPLSRLTSFTEDMERRGISTRSEWLKRGIYPSSPYEMMQMGLSAGEMVARFERIRFRDNMPLAIERACVAADLIPNPMEVETSLYDVLSRYNARPDRATQRISARNVNTEEANLLAIAPGDAIMSIERVSYSVTGRVVEYTRSSYRGDSYDFVAELKIPK